MSFCASAPVRQRSNSPRADGKEMLDPGLYLVSTPIGNLEDITLRALRVLRQAACVFAEDTRHTLKLLNYYGIRTRMLSCHAHNEAERSRALVERVRRGEVRRLGGVCGL